MKSEVRRNSFLVLGLFIMLAAKLLWANPAKPRPIVLIQPDGHKFTATLKGDEHFAFAETPDGFSIIMDQNSGYWCYAQKTDGLLFPSSYKVGKSDCPFPRKLRPDAIKVARLARNEGKMINLGTNNRHKRSTDFLYGKNSTKLSPSKAPSGKHYINILLGDFTDSTFAVFSAKQTDDPLAPNYNPWNPFPKETYRHMIWQVMGDRDSAKPVIPDSTTVGSMSNFFWDMTYQQVYWSQNEGAEITGVDTIRSSGMDWQSANQMDGIPKNYAKACVEAADPYVDFDSDDDGVQDALVIVHPGPGEDESGRPGDIWSMSAWGLNIKADGVNGLISLVVFVPQNGQLGVFCHEMFHQLGGPDLYDYGYTSVPWGMWSLMDNGSWGGPLGGDQPTFVGGHLIYDIDGELTNGIDGFLPASATDSISSAHNGDGRYTVAVLDSAGAARNGNFTSGVRLWRVCNDAFNDSSQLFLVENRQRHYPYESGLPENGIIITHIDTRMSGGSVTFNDGPPVTDAFYSWVENPGYDPNPAYAAANINYNRNEANAAYSADDYNPGGYNETTLDSTTVPTSWINTLSTGAAGITGPWIFDVSKEGQYMSFSVARTGLAAAQPLVGYASSVVDDPVISGTANNNNSLLDPWETDSVMLNFSNNGASITNGARCSLYAVSNSQYVTIIPGWKTVGGGALPSGSQALSQPFVVAVSSDAPRFTDVGFAVRFRSTTPACSSTSYFVLRISPLNVVKVYDFQNILVGGTDFNYRIQPSDLAIYRDTLIIANANLDNNSLQTRLYKVNKNTVNNPLQAADTFGSLNNKVTTHNSNMYVCGLDVDNSGNLWYSIQDSIYHTNRGTTLLSKLRAPNCDWLGNPYMKRIRGVGFGPSVVDTIGPDPISGDSLLVYWQQFNQVNYSEFSTDSIWCLSQVNNATSAISNRWAFYDSGWAGVMNCGWGYNAWNGRAIEYDGSSFWTSAIDIYLIIRRDPIDASILQIMPSPSSGGAYGSYCLAPEATDSLGTEYAPTGAFVYQPYAKGTRHYLYCSSMEEGKIYKIDITDICIPTPPESVTVAQTGPSSNLVRFYKQNVDQQKINKYIIYRQPAAATEPPTSADSVGWVGHLFGTGVVDSFVDGSATEDYKYTALPVNYYGYGGWGASALAPLTYVGSDVPLKNLPLKYDLMQNYPNPMAQGQTLIKYALKKTGQTELKIYNLLGEEVRTLINGRQEAGYYTVNWNGQNEQGLPASNGIYFYKLNSGGFSATKKMVLIR